LRAQK